MKLYFQTFDERIKSVKEKMEEMVVAHELVTQKDLSIPLLEFGSDRVEGVEDILKYLEDLHLDMQKGYYCAC